ncbi:MAG: TIGR03936 family radical SAM-associated protein [Bacillota bacterium]
MFRYRIAFCKDGPARWIGHLDLMRALERAFRRAGLPLCYSEGFNPRPKFVFALPLPVGVVGVKELVDIYLRVPVNPEAITARLSAVLPEGLSVRTVTRVPREAPNLMAAVGMASYRAEGHVAPTVTAEQVAAAVKAVLEAKEIMCTREGKGGPKERDIRPGIFMLEGSITRDTLTIDMKVQAGQQGNIRPIDVVDAFLRLSGLPGNPHDYVYYHTGVFMITDSRAVSLG